MNEAKVSHSCLLSSSFLYLNNRRPSMGLPSWGPVSLRLDLWWLMRLYTEPYLQDWNASAWPSGYNTSSSFPSTRPFFGLHRPWLRVNNPGLAWCPLHYFVHHTMPSWCSTLQLPQVLLPLSRMPFWRVCRSSSSFCKPTALLGARQAMALLPP